MSEIALPAALALVAAAVLLASPAEAADRSDSVAAVFASIRSHEFHPLDNRAFTIDRELKKDGIASLNDPDWRVRLLAVRDLVRAGSEAVGDIAAGLEDEHVQVRYLSAVALGVLGRSEARPALEHALQQDGEAVVRSQAAIALGQINDKASLPVLRDRLEHDPSKDVRHQCELSIDQIEKGQAATDALRAAYRDLDPGTFETARVGQPAPSFTLTDTDGQAHRPIGERGEDWIVLIWIFADWCPVCHGEFRELIEMRRDFELAGVRVYTIETHDFYRARVMVGKEVDPEYWFARESFQEAYTQKIWWPHLVDHAGAVGASYGIDPMAFAVHAEYINRPATIIIDPAGRVRWAYYGTYWGDRPSIKKTLEMIQSEVFTFVHPNRLGEP
jgi:peroxiredoxin